MSQLTLSLRPEIKTRVDMTGITPDRLQDLTQSAIRKLKLQAGTQSLPLDKLFSIQGQAKSADMVLRGSRGLLDNIGRDMQSGRLTVQGKAGDFTGYGLRGGEILVTGDSGHWAGRDMRGGRLDIRGSAGDYLAAAFPGDQYGMRDGLIVVHGHAGDRAGERMRRGVVLIKGDAGDYCGARVRAGTLIVQGSSGRFIGTQMKRGTIILSQAPDGLPATFNDCGEYEPVFLALLYRKLSAKDRLRDMKHQPVRVRRLAGDLAVAGKGEILILQDH